VPFLLFALPRRRLSDEEVNAVADMLVRDGHPSRTDVAEVITAITHQPPLESNIDRVGKRLGEGGWLIGNDE
jgi:Protein of unknown function (DUF3349)